MNVYTRPCWHSWRVKARDWIHLERHPREHVVGTTALFRAVRDRLAMAPAIDLELDSLKVELTPDTLAAELHPERVEAGIEVRRFTDEM